MVPTIPTISSPLRSSIIYDHGTIFLAFLITNLLLTNLESSLCVVIMSRTSISVNPHSIVYLNVKELLARSRRHIWSLSHSNVIQTHNHLVCKRTLNHLAKLARWLSCVVSTYLYGTFDCVSFIMSRTSIRVNPHSTHRTDMYSPHSSIICLVWLNRWVFVYELSGCRFE